MKFQFEFDGVKSNADLKERIGKKFAALEKYLVNVKEDFHTGMLRIIKGERWGYKVKIDVKLPGKNIVAESKAEELMDAVDGVYEKSARQIREYFEKLKEKRF